MLRIAFSNHDIEQLRYERYHHPHPRVQQKMEALLLKSQNLAHQVMPAVLASAKTACLPTFAPIKPVAFKHSSRSTFIAQRAS